jgi:hypothetical protein
MKYLIAVAVFVIAIPVQAQTPRVEVFAGASGFRSGQVLEGSQYYFDGQGEITVDVSKHVGIVADAGEQRQPFSGRILYNLQGMAGVEYAWHRHRLSPFVHGLGGYAQSGVGPVRVCCPASTIPSLYSSGYAVAAGGGADIGLTRLLAVRGLVDWVPEREHSPWFKNEYRVGIGIVFRFGGARSREVQRYRDTPAKVAGYGD